MARNQIGISRKGVARLLTFLAMSILLHANAKGQSNNPLSAQEDASAWRTIEKVTDEFDSSLRFEGRSFSHLEVAGVSNNYTVHLGMGIEGETRTDDSRVRPDRAQSLFNGDVAIFDMKAWSGICFDGGRLGYREAKRCEPASKFITMCLVSAGGARLSSVGPLLIATTDLSSPFAEESIRLRLQINGKPFSAPFLGGMAGPRRLTPKEESLPILGCIEKSPLKTTFDGTLPHKTKLLEAVHLVMFGHEFMGGHPKLGPVVVLLDVRSLEGQDKSFTWHLRHGNNSSFYISGKDAGLVLDLLTEPETGSDATGERSIFFEYPYILASGKTVKLELGESPSEIKESLTLTTDAK